MSKVQTLHISEKLTLLVASITAIYTTAVTNDISSRLGILRKMSKYQLNNLHFNPLQLQSKIFFLYYIGYYLSRESVNIGMKILVKTKNSPAHSAPRKPRTTLDNILWVLNQAVEPLFAVQVMWILFKSDLVDRSIPSIGVSSLIDYTLKSIAAYLCLNLVDDFIYAQVHKFMHLKSIYWLTHKHHHSVIYPSEGYLEAVNETPQEIVLASIGFLSAYYVTYALLGAMPFLGVSLFFFIFGLTPMLNHMNAKFVLYLPFIFDPSDHLVHHKLSKFNYAQRTMIWDKLYNQFLEHA